MFTILYLIYYFKDFCSSFCQTKDYESRKKHIESDSSVDYGINKMTVTIGEFVIKIYLQTTIIFQIYSYIDFTYILLMFCCR